MAIPETGILDAPGLGNDLATVKEDQARRTQANLEALQNGVIPPEAE